MTNLTMSILVKRGAEQEWTNDVDDPARAEALNWVYNELVGMGSDYIDEDAWQIMIAGGIDAAVMGKMDDAAKCHDMCVTEEYWRNRIFDCLTTKLTGDGQPDVSFTKRMLIVAATALAAVESRIRLGI